MLFAEKGKADVSPRSISHIVAKSTRPEVCLPCHQMSSNQATAFQRYTST
jgi:hypothetical protein